QEREQMARAGVELAQENLRLAAVSYREGVSIMLNVITAQVNLEQARNALINARFDMNVRKARLYQALGLDIIEHIK
ncbi:MAG: TolC family protein, partial [Candidatus Sericytochromatia bacterium]